MKGDELREDKEAASAPLSVGIWTKRGGVENSEG